MSTAAKLLREQKNLLPQDGPVPNRRVLIVDDEVAIAEGIRRILTPEKNLIPRSSRNQQTPQEPSIAQGPEFDVTVVHTPSEALASIEKSLEDKRPYAMGFFDVMLGADIDGIELVKRCLQIDPKIFAVFVTAYHDRNVDAIGAYIGLENRERWDYINKPFTNGEILQKARNATSLWDLHKLKEWQADRLSEAHQLLLQNERLNSAAAVGRSVAHEFGNLLTHIVGHAEIALNQDKPQAMKDSLEIILKASDTATAVLKRFRKLNKPVDNSSEIKLTDLSLVLEEALELMEFRFRRHKVKIEKASVKPTLAEANRNSLIQVFVNLFINAMHAMPDGGTIYVQLASSEDSSLAQLRIRDTGSGIPAEILHKVTEPLFTTKGNEGSGLGLSICKEIIEIEHAGESSLQNHPQGGVEVSISIPFRQEQSEGENE